MNTEYIKNYKQKELKQYVLAYLLIAVSSVGLYTKDNIVAAGVPSSLLTMAAIDLLVGAICVLVFVFNELWSDRNKTRIIYRKLPSDTVFSDIASGKIDATGFDIAKAQEMYAHLSDAGANQQTAEWNRLLGKSRSDGNVIEAERMQLLTRDICLTTISLLIMTLAALVVMMAVFKSAWTPIKLLAIPLLYLIIMLFVSKYAARNRARRLVAAVIKNDVQNDRHEGKGSKPSSVALLSGE